MWYVFTFCLQLKYQTKMTRSLASLLTEFFQQVMIGDKANPESIKAALLQKVSRGEGSMHGFAKRL